MPNNQLTHDSELSNICVRLFHLRNVFDISVVKQEDLTTKSSLIPDAELTVSTDNVSVNIAVEYELTQKSKNRINQKFLSYSQSNDHQYVLYFFDNDREALVYVNNLHTLETSKLNHHATFRKDKFYFFVRKSSNDMTSFLKSFKPIYPVDVNPLINLLNS
jgi:hypothetical protein